jgi:hypothetical protein
MDCVANTIVANAGKSVSGGKGDGTAFQVVNPLLASLFD